MTTLTKKSSVFFIALSALLLSLTFAPGFAAAADKTSSADPVQFVQKLGDTALMSLTAKNVNRTTREKRVRDILRSHFDLQIIGRSALGTYWKEASDSQRKEYMNLFEDMIVQTYTTRFEDYSGQTLKVDKSTASGEKTFIVSSQVIQKDGPPVNLEWRVHSKDGTLKIVDVIVEGVSMAVTQRSDFSAVIQHGGGSIDALITSLRERKKANANQKT